MTKTMEISISNLRNHPNNVRKTYTGIPELAASIKENGILQNLTVVPDPKNEGIYLVVIGNRRLRAAIKAGLQTVPCVVTDMEEADQALTMLTENMQRRDLSLIEESDGFQMCLEDFGINIGTLAEKTGFSKTTVRHRLNVAKLDRGILTEKMDDPEFQLTITDLTLLEKVRDIDRRNEILDEAEDSREIAWLVEQAVLEENRERTAKKLAALAKKESIAEAPIEVVNLQYSYPWATIRSISLDQELPGHLLDESDLEEYPEEIYYIVQPTTFKVVGKRVPKELPQDDTDGGAASDTDVPATKDADEKDTSNTETDTATAEATQAEPDSPSEEELRETDRRARHAQYKELYRDLYAELHSFCSHLIDGKIDAPEDAERYAANCWSVLRDIGLFVSRKPIAGMILRKASFSVSDSELDALADRIDDMPAHAQMLAVICHHMNVYQIVTDRIIRQLEEGVIPWTKSWISVRDGAFNRVSKKSYSILNQLLLSRRGEYATYRQWQDLGGQVRKGAKSEIVVFWKLLDRKPPAQASDKAERQGKIPLLRYYSVFHISDVDGVEPLETGTLYDTAPDEAAERVFRHYVERERIHTEIAPSNRAYYSPSRDTIHLPDIRQYKNPADYYSVAFHEATHSTGHRTRLGRFSPDTPIAPFGSEDYSKEELIAELGSAAILNTLGLETTDTFQGSAAYIHNWLSVLKNDSRFIVSASAKADKAVDLILANS